MYLSVAVCIGYMISTFSIITHIHTHICVNGHFADILVLVSCYIKVCKKTFGGCGSSTFCTCCPFCFKTNSAKNIYFISTKLRADTCAVHCRRLLLVFVYSKNSNVLLRLAKIADYCVRKTGFFQSQPPYYCRKLRPNSRSVRTF